MERGRAGTDSSQTSASQVILDQQGPMSCCPTGSRRETPRDSHALRPCSQLEEFYHVVLRLWPGTMRNTKEESGVYLGDF